MHLPEEHSSRQAVQKSVNHQQMATAELCTLLSLVQLFLVYKIEMTHFPNSQNGFPKEGDSGKDDIEKSHNYQSSGKPQATGCCEQNFLFLSFATYLEVKKFWKSYLFFVYFLGIDGL